MACRLAGWLARSEAALALCALVVAPAAIFFLNPPNLQYPRYFLVFGVVFVMLMAKAAGRLWETRPGKAFIPVALLLFGLGQAMSTMALARNGRGDVSVLIATIAQGPGATYASSIKPAGQYVLDYYARRAGLDLRRIPLPLACAETPAFYVIGAPLDAPISELRLTLGPQACPTEYAQVADAPGSALSGAHWRLFRRVAPISATR